MSQLVAETCLAAYEIYSNQEVRAKTQARGPRRHKILFELQVPAMLFQLERRAHLFKITAAST